MEQEYIESGAVINTDVPGCVSIPKQRRKLQKDLLRKVFYDYASNTTLHGLPYTTKKGVTPVEKIFWTITFVLSLCLCGYLISKIWVKWQTSPVIVTINEKFMSVRKIPFPSVTICPATKTSKSVYNYESEVTRLMNFLNSSADPLDVERNVMNNIQDFVKLENMIYLCGEQFVHFHLKFQYPDIFNKYEEKKHLYQTKVEDILNVAPKKENLFGCCWFDHLNDLDYFCNDSLTEVLTIHGLCYNFNSLAAHEILRDNNNIHMNAEKTANNWTVEEGYNKSTRDVYPLSGKGNRDQLVVIFEEMLEERDDLCNVKEAGSVKIFIEHPTDLPGSSQNYYVMHYGELTSLALSLNIISTSESLRKYSADIRQCYFPGERYLKYFKLYTENNCNTECRSNWTIDECRCAEFYMPHENATRICTDFDKVCVGTVEEKFTEAGEEACNCLPTCYYIDYQAEIIKTTINYEKHYKSRTKKIKGNSLATLSFHFKGTRFSSMRRSELFGVIDFLANIGGILGLFLGFSFLSLIEIFYYLSLRLFCTLKQDINQENEQSTHSKSPEKF